LALVNAKGQVVNGSEVAEFPREILGFNHVKQPQFSFISLFRLNVGYKVG
jgi:hypothetical protein